MASVSSVNPGLSDLLQTLASIDSPVVSSPAAITALEKASPTDIVQLSEAAIQLEGLDEMFGIQNGAQNGLGPTNLEDLMNAAVGASIASPAPAVATAATTAAGSSDPSPLSTTSSTPSLADQLADYQLASQTSEVQALFDPGASGGLSNPLLNLIA
jgi:hypothetical protein